MSGTKGRRMEIVVSSKHCYLCSSPCSSVESLPWDTALQELIHPFHGVQSFRNRLLQYGSPTASEVLPANLFLSRLLYIGCSFCQKPATMWPLQGLQLPSGHVCFLLCGVLHVMQGGQLVSSWSSPWAARQFLLQLLEYLPSFFTHVALFMAISLTFFSLHLSLSFWAAFSILFKHVITACHWCSWLWPVARPFQSQLELALSKMGAALELFSQKPLLQPLPTPQPDWFWFIDNL